MISQSSRWNWRRSFSGALKARPILDYSLKLYTIEYSKKKKKKTTQKKKEIYKKKMSCHGCDPYPRCSSSPSVVMILPQAQPLPPPPMYTTTSPYPMAQPSLSYALPPYPVGRPLSAAPYYAPSAPAYAPSAPMYAPSSPTYTTAPPAPYIPVGQSVTVARARQVEWEPDCSRTTCSRCSRPFSFFNRRHHCRNCGKLFCGDCTAYTLPLPEKGYHHYVRVCDSCVRVIAPSYCC